MTIRELIECLTEAGNSVGFDAEVLVATEGNLLTDSVWRGFPALCVMHNEDTKQTFILTEESVAETV